MRPRHRRRNADSPGDKDPRTGTRGRVGPTATGQWSPGEHCAGSAGCRALPSTQRASVLAPATHETRAATGESDGSRVSPTPSSAADPHSAPGAVASQDYRGTAPELGRPTTLRLPGALLSGVGGPPARARGGGGRAPPRAG